MKLASIVAFAVFAAVASAHAQPSSNGQWIVDRATGCRVWSPSARLNETVWWIGACTNGLAQGRGTVRWFVDGRSTGRYEGEMRDGKAHGRGIYLGANNDRYDGEFSEGRASGHGVLDFAEGDRYDGEVRDDIPNGDGRFITRSGETFSGTWTNGCLRAGNRWITVGTTAEACGFR